MYMNKKINSYIGSILFRFVGLIKNGMFGKDFTCRVCSCVVFIDDFFVLFYLKILVYRKIAIIYNVYFHNYNS